MIHGMFGEMLFWRIHGKYYVVAQAKVPLFRRNQFNVFESISAKMEVFVTNFFHLQKSHTQCFIESRVQLGLVMFY